MAYNNNYINFYLLEIIKMIDFEYYKQQITEIFRLIPVVVKALWNTLKYMGEVWQDMKRWDEVMKDIKNEQQKIKKNNILLELNIGDEKIFFTNTDCFSTIAFESDTIILNNKENACENKIYNELN